MFSPALVPLVLSKFLTEHVKGQLRLLILVAPCWMETPWLPLILNMLADVPQCCPIIKRSRGVFGRPCAQWCAISSFNPLTAQRCVVQTGVLFLSLSGSGGSKLSTYSKGLLAVLEGMGRLVCLRWCTKNAN